jgi:hypothetical protein
MQLGVLANGLKQLRGLSTDESYRNTNIFIAGPASPFLIVLSDQITRSRDLFQQSTMVDWNCVSLKKTENRLQQFPHDRKPKTLLGSFAH